jgi:hypothetical protein
MWMNLAKGFLSTFMKRSHASRVIAWSACIREQHRATNYKQYCLKLLIATRLRYFEAALLCLWERRGEMSLCLAPGKSGRGDAAAS